VVDIPAFGPVTTVTLAPATTCDAVGVVSVTVPLSAQHVNAGLGGAGGVVGDVGLLLLQPDPRATTSKTYERDFEAMSQHGLMSKAGLYR